MCYFKIPARRAPLVPSERCECYTNDPSFPNISLKKRGNDRAKNAFALHFISAHSASLFDGAGWGTSKEKANQPGTRKKVFASLFKKKKCNLVRHERRGGTGERARERERGRERKGKKKIVQNLPSNKSLDCWWHSYNADIVLTARERQHSLLLWGDLASLP